MGKQKRKRSSGIRLFDLKTFVAGAVVSFLLGASLASGICLGFLWGRWWGEWELFYLMDLPQGGIVLSSRTNAYWHKMDGNTMRFVRIPDPRQARATRLFDQTKQEEGKQDENVDSSGKRGPAARGNG